MDKLISAEKLCAYIKEQINPYGKPFEGSAYDFGLKLMDYIGRMDAAYDLDRVIEQMKDNKSSALHDLTRSRGTAYEYANERVYNAWKKSIEIAMKGGIVDE